MLIQKIDCNLYIIVYTRLGFLYVKRGLYLDNVCDTESVEDLQCHSL